MERGADACGEGDFGEGDEGVRADGVDVEVEDHVGVVVVTWWCGEVSEMCLQLCGIERTHEIADVEGGRGGVDGW